MANPKPDLQGFADPSIEGWRQRAIDAVQARQHKNRRHNERSSGLYLFFDDQWRVYLDAAARRRNISLTGYMRRAVTAMIAFDLGLEPAEVGQHAAEPVEYGKGGGGRNKRTHDTMVGKGPWRITGLDEA